MHRSFIWCEQNEPVLPVLPTSLCQPLLLVVQEKPTVAVPLSSQHLSGLESEPQPALEDTADSSEDSPQAMHCHSKLAAADVTPLPVDIHDMGATSSGQSLLHFQGENATDGKDNQLSPTTDEATVTGHVQVNMLCASSTPFPVH